ncbi:MAG: hypothetical protein WCC59_18595 [Terriglobales bacterium]
MNTTTTSPPPETSPIKTTKTKKICIKGNGQVIDHRTWYNEGETITFVSDKDASVTFANYKLFKMNGVRLEANEPIVLEPNHPEESRFSVSYVTISQTGVRTLTQVDLEGFARTDPPVIVPGS